MPSFRVVLTLGRVHPGADPRAALPAAAGAVAARTTVEARSVGVVKGRGQAVVRFEAEDASAARPIAEAAAAAAGESAEVLEMQLRRQSGGRWVPA